MKGAKQVQADLPSHLKLVAQRQAEELFGFIAPVPLAVPAGQMVQPVVVTIELAGQLQELSELLQV
jgi:hypothetical protein